MTLPPERASKLTPEKTWLATFMLARFASDNVLLEPLAWNVRPSLSLFNAVTPGKLTVPLVTKTLEPSRSVRLLKEGVPPLTLIVPPVKLVNWLVLMVPVPSSVRFTSLSVVNNESSTLPLLVACMHSAVALSAETG